MLVRRLVSLKPHGRIGAVADLQKDNEMLQEIAAGQSWILEAQDLAAQEKEENTATSTAVTLPLLSVGGGGRELTTQASPQLGE